MPEPTPFFYGYQSTLEKIHRTLHITHLTQPIPKVALLGFSGEGKSEIAKTYAWNHRAFYSGGTLFIQAEDPTLIKICFERIAQQVGLLNPDKASPAAYLPLCQAIYHRLSHRGKTLLIFDGAKNHDAIEPYFPSALEGFSSEQFSILVTSGHTQHFLNYHERLFLSPESEKEAAIAYIQRHLPQASGEESARLFEQVHGLPLALSQLVSYLKCTTRFTIAQYLQETPTITYPVLSHASLEAPPLYHQRALSRLVLLSLEKLHHTHSTFLPLVNILAFLADTPIPIAFFQMVCRTLSLAPNEAQECLISLGFMRLQETERVFTLHSLVQTIIREQIEKSQWLSLALQAFFALCQTGRYDRQQPWVLQTILYHVDFLQTYLQQHPEEYDDILVYTLDYSTLLYHHALFEIDYERRYAKAKSHLSCAKGICLFLTGEENQHLLQKIHRQLAKVHVLLGELQEATFLYDALEQQPLVPGFKEAILLDRQCCLVKKDQPEEAKDILETLLQNPMLSTDKTARAHHELGKLLFSQAQRQQGLIKKIETDIAELPRWKTRVRASEEQKKESLQTQIFSLQQKATHHFQQAVALKKQQGDRFEIIRTYLMLFQWQIKTSFKAQAAFDSLSGLLEASEHLTTLGHFPYWQFRIMKAMAQFKSYYGVHGLSAEDQIRFQHTLDKGLAWLATMEDEQGKQRKTIMNLLSQVQSSLFAYGFSSRAEPFAAQKRKREEGVSISSTSLQSAPPSHQTILNQFWKPLSEEPDTAKRAKGEEMSSTGTQGITPSKGGFFS